LADKVAGLASEFNDNILNDIVIFANSNGKILEVFNQDCECWSSFASYVNEFPSIIGAGISAKDSAK
jgi:hypothetical protein